MTLRDGERRNTAEQLELPLDQQPSAPFVGKVLRTVATPPTPPRIPAGDQRLIRLLGIGALVAALVTIGGALTVDPVVEQTRALAVAGALALTVALGLTGLLLLWHLWRQR